MPPRRPRHGVGYSLPGNRSSSRGRGIYALQPFTPLTSEALDSPPPRASSVRSTNPAQSKTVIFRAELQPQEPWTEDEDVYLVEAMANKIELVMLWLLSIVCVVALTFPETYSTIRDVCVFVWWSGKMLYMFSKKCVGIGSSIIRRWLFRQEEGITTEPHEAKTLAVQLRA
ncbi:hypothetical protein B7494_g1846 [Chlorociboria aeruginascens]|nr:hypothetical protein B7494_g1846 [Chlorociboria aeruginascens]